MFKNPALWLVILALGWLAAVNISAAVRADETDAKAAKKEDKKDKKDKKTKDKDKRGKLAREFEKKKAFYFKQLEKDADFRAEIEAAYRDKLREHGEFAATVNNLNPSKPAVETQSPLAKFDQLYDNPLVTDYVNRVGQSLIPKDSPKSYIFKVTLNPIPETRALTTGTIYISTGLLAMVDNEAQLAYLLAHEVGHVEREHWKDDIVFELGLKRYANHKSFSQNLLSKILPLLSGPMLRVPIDEMFTNVAGGILSDRALGSLPKIMGSTKLKALLETPFIDQNLPDVLKLFSPGSVIAWDKVQEDQADNIAVNLLLERNYDPREAVSLLTKMREESGGNKRLAVGFVADIARVSGRIGELQTQFAGLQSKVFAKKLNIGSVNLTQIAKTAGIDKMATDTFNGATNELKKQVATPVIDSGSRLASLQYAMGGDSAQSRVASGELLAGSEEFQIIASQLKRDNGIRSLNFDHIDTARKQLAEALEINASDPQTNYYLGLLTRTTARTLKDKTAALEMLAAAVKNDPSGLLPNSRFERAVAILEASATKPNDEEKQQIAEMLREYVSLYRRQNAGQNPVNINRVDDYLRLIGQQFLNPPNAPAQPATIQLGVVQ